MSLDEGLIGTLNEQYPCRTQQIRQLVTFYSPSFPNPSTLVVHGLQATGKTSIIRGVLTANNVTHAFVDSKECITGRHLLERTLIACLHALTDVDDPSRSIYQKCENIAALDVQLRSLLEGRGRFVLVFDGVDKQREAPPTLLPALARFGELIPNLSVIMVLSVPSPRFLHTTGVPYVHFPPYSREQAIRILSISPPPIFLELNDPEYGEEDAAEDSAWLWGRFCVAVWDSLGKGAARDLLQLKRTCEKLWRPFVAPVVDGTFGTRDFSRLMVSRRTLFQSEDALLDQLVVPDDMDKSIVKAAKPSHDLPYYTKYLLCAAYLASFNAPRTDTLFFMKATERKRRKKGGGTAVHRGRVAKHRKIPRNMLNPAAFPLDRLLAIFRAILPDPVPQTADLYTQLATLSSLKLLVRIGAAAADVLDPACKWRVNVAWEHVLALGRTVGCEMTDFLAHTEV